MDKRPASQHDRRDRDLNRDLDIAALETSFALIAPKAEELVARFYSELFCRHPAVESLFVDTDMQAQQDKLLAALKLVVENIRHPAKLLPVLRELGQRHEAYGASPAHYVAVAETLLDVMGDIAGDAWTTQIRDAWSGALGLIADVMLNEYRHAVASDTESDIESNLESNFEPNLKPNLEPNRKSTSESNEEVDMSKESTAAENSRIKQALDSVSANVMVADANLEIIYMNNTVTEMFQAAEADIRKDLPRFDVRSLMGTNIDDFHKNPAHQRGLLAELSDTFESRLELGGRTFSIIANPIIADDGERIGTVVEWQDLTEQLAREEEERKRVEAERLIAAENGRIKQALDGVTTNVMIGDNDLNIVYMNEAVTKLFREVESDVRKDLPSFDANNLLGTCIDLFHKNPAHQRSMLARLTATHTAELDVGGRTMRVIASPVFDNDGERLGTVVEWADRTQELAIEKEVETVVGGAVEGDLTKRIPTEDKTGFFQNLGNSVNELMVKLTGVVGEIQHASDNVKAGAQEIAEGNTDLSQRTEEQASSLEETSSSMEEMTSAVRESADNAAHANQLAKEARKEAEQGGAVVEQAVNAMQEINEASKKIADIISVIDEIAFQTNLLALNAAVEAARAGDQGRGFAVVAGEVRNLAGRSASAAKEIKGLIVESLAKVEDGSKLVNQSGEALDKIVNGSKKVTDIVGEIAASSQEQSAGIDEINKAVLQMDELTQQNAALVEQIAAASESMGEQAQGLANLMDFFTVEEGAAAPPPVAASTEPPAVNRMERRSSQRPWSKPKAVERKKTAVTNGSAIKASGSDAAAVDEEWESF